MIQFLFYCAIFATLSVVGFYFLPFILLYYYIKTKKQLYIVGIVISSVLVLFVISNKSLETTKNKDSIAEAAVKQETREKNKTDRPSAISDNINSKRSTGNMSIDAFNNKVLNILKESGSIHEYYFHHSTPYIEIDIYSSVKYDYDNLLEKYKIILTEIYEISRDIPVEYSYVNITFYRYVDRFKTPYIEKANYDIMGSFQISANQIHKLIEWN